MPPCIITLRGLLVDLNGMQDRPAPAILNTGDSSVLIDFPDSSAASGSFQPAIFFDALRTKVLGSVLLTAPELPSTQTLLQDNPASLTNGIVCVADRQVKGKGKQHDLMRCQMHHVPAAECTSGGCRTWAKPMGVAGGLSHVLRSDAPEHCRWAHVLLPSLTRTLAHAGTRMHLSSIIFPTIGRSHLNKTGVLLAAGQRLPFVQYVVSLALVQAIQEQARAKLQVRTCTYFRCSSAAMKLYPDGFHQGAYRMPHMEDSFTHKCQVAALLLQDDAPMVPDRASRLTCGSSGPTTCTPRA